MCSYLELGALPTAVPCARLHARHLLWEWGLSALVEDTELLTSELITNAVKATADGDAYARLTNATAEANAIKVQSQALAQNAGVLELRRITVEQTKAEKWDGKLPEAIYANAPIPFLNVGTK